jgi:hypothetical protein
MALSAIIFSESSAVANGSTPRSERFLAYARSARLYKEISWESSLDAVPVGLQAVERMNHRSVETNTAKFLIIFVLLFS